MSRIGSIPIVTGFETLFNWRRYNIGNMGWFYPGWPIAANCSPFHGYASGCNRLSHIVVVNMIFVQSFLSCSSNRVTRVCPVKDRMFISWSMGISMSLRRVDHSRGESETNNGRYLHNFIPYIHPNITVRSNAADLLPARLYAAR